MPEEVLKEKLGFIQFPNRYWFLAIGNWIGVTILYSEFLFYACSMMRAHPRHSYKTLVDKHTRLAAAPKRAQVESPKNEIKAKAKASQRFETVKHKPQHQS